MDALTKVKLGRIEYRPIKSISAAAYTLVAGDETKYLEFTSTSLVTVTVPTGFDSTDEFKGKVLGSGGVQFSAGTGFSLANITTAKTGELFQIHLTTSSVGLLSVIKIISGSTGSFTSADGKTVTVTNGLITSIV